MDQTLQELICIFEPDGFDWMNFSFTKGNPFTYHHIDEKCNGGERSIDNGAILTKKAHRFLNLLQLVYPDAYNDLQNVFRKINGTKEPVAQDFIDEIDEILNKVLVTKEYKYYPLRNIVDSGNVCQLFTADDYKKNIKNNLVWKSSDEKIAVVDNNGIVKGIRPGIVNISATYGDIEVISQAVKVIDISTYCKMYKSNRKVKKITK